MANSLEIFNSKFVKDKLIGDNNFFNNSNEVKEYSNLQKKYISNIDYSVPSNFARFGSAEEYYKNAINYINSNYPYAGSTSEKLNWINSLNEFEFHIYDNEFPRAVGHSSVSGTQYIKVYSHVKEPETTAKDAYDAGTRYTANTILSLEDGFTFESWLKFEDSSQNTRIININAITSSEDGPTNVDLITISRTSGSNPLFQLEDGINTYQFNTSIPDNEWHHYSFFIKNDIISLSIDGQLVEESSVTISPGITSYIFVPLGLMWLPLYQTEPFVGDLEKSAVFEIGGGGKLSLDETRFWNGPRTVEKIGRYWFTNIDGNDFSDTNNSNLLFYYKFNEGWDSVYQLLCLDYSGRDNDGEIIEYDPTCRISSSAIDLSGLVQDLEKKDIIFKGLSYSQEVKNFYDRKIAAGIDHDETNMHLLYKKFPSWVLEEEEDKQSKHLKQIIQIISSYFDDLFNKIGEITEYKKQRFDDNTDNIYPFYDKILTSTGFDVTDLFTNLDIIEKISSRNDITLFDSDYEKIKNTIFRNIYSNLAYILKSKGTEKSIKSFLRSYGIDENLVKINLYADKNIYSITDRSKETVVRKKTVTMTGDSTIYLSSSAISETYELNYYTLETSVIFASELSPKTSFTSSIFGLQNNIYDTDLASANSNYEYAVLLENNVDLGYKFILSGSSIGVSTSSYFQNLYDNSVWNLAIRKKPNVDTLYGMQTIPQYTFELYAVNKNSHIEKEFSCSLTPHTHVDGYLRHYIGAKNTDMTGSCIYESNSKFLYCNFWTNYLNNEEITSHNKDILNYGASE